MNRPSVVPVQTCAPSEDARAEVEVFAAIAGIADDLRRIQAEAVKAYGPEVEAIIRERSRDVDRIEHTLDGILDFCGDDAALALFKRLCCYYWDIDPHATARHVLAYREWFDSEGP